MSYDDIQAIELVFEGWLFGIMTAILYATIANYRQIKRRNRRHRDLLNAGVDPVTILMTDDV